MNEFQEDLKKLLDHVECFQEKHNCCVVNAVAKELDEEKAACSVFIKGGESTDLHMLCHGLLKSPRFVDEMVDAIKCVLKEADPDKDPFKSAIMEGSMDAMKRLLILVAVKEQEKKKDLDSIVDSFLNDFYHGNN